MKKTPEEFRNWIEKKIEIVFSNKTNDVKVWEFCWYYEGMNVWNEISKDNQFKRACLILKTDLWNGLVMVAPLTSQFHQAQQNYYIKVDANAWLSKQSNVILN